MVGLAWIPEANVLSSAMMHNRAATAIAGASEATARIPHPPAQPSPLATEHRPKWVAEPETEKATDTESIRIPGST